MTVRKPILILVFTGLILAFSSLDSIQDHGGFARASSGAQLLPDEVKKEVEWSIRYSDLIVRGTVRYIMQSTERMGDLYPGYPHARDARALVRLLSIDVEDVIKGSCGEDLAIVVPGMRGIPPCEPGQVIVVSANYNAVLDRFVLRDYNGFFVETGQTWSNQSEYSVGNIEYDASEVRDIVRSVDLPAIVGQADYVGIGEVVRVDARDTAAGRTTTTQFAVRKVLGGRNLAATITVVSEETMRPRSAPIPVMKPGDVWYFALRENGSRLQPVDGPNSLLKWEDGVLRYNGRAPYSRSVLAFERAASEARD